MLPKRPLRGHRRTMSSSEVQIGSYINTAPDRTTFEQTLEEPPKTSRERQLIVAEINDESPMFPQSEDTVSTYVKASNQNCSEKMVIVEQLQTDVQYQDPLFQFGKTKRSSFAGLVDPQAKDLPVPKGYSKKEDNDLFMIPELNFKQAFKKKSESSRLTKAAEGPIVNGSHKRVNNLMSKRTPPLESTILKNTVAGRVRAERRQPAQKHQLFAAQKMKARVNLVKL